MKVFIKKVNKNFGKSGKICHEAWVYGELESKNQIELFDADCIIPKSCIGKIVDCLISMMISKGKNGISIKGKYIGNYIMPRKWLELYKDLHEYLLETLKGIETENGIFFTGPDDINCKIGEIIDLNVIRFDVFAWRPIEED